MPPEEILQQTLNNTTHFYLSVEEENQQDPSRHNIFRFSGLRYPRQIETVASDIFSPAGKSSHGKTFSQFFIGDISGRWIVYLLGKESHNANVLQY